MEENLLLEFEEYVRSDDAILKEKVRISKDRRLTIDYKLTTTHTLETS